MTGTKTKNEVLSGRGRVMAQWLLPLVFPIALLASVFLIHWSIPVVLTVSLILMALCQFVLKLVEKNKYPNWYGFFTMFVFWGIITIGGMQIHKAVLDSREANRKPRFVTKLNGFVLSDMVVTNTIEVAQQDNKYTLHVEVWNEGDALAENVLQAVTVPVWMDVAFPSGWTQGSAPYRPGFGTEETGFKAFLSPEAYSRIVHPHNCDLFNVVICLTNQPPINPFNVKFTTHAKGLEHIRVVPVRLLPQ